MAPPLYHTSTQSSILVTSEDIPLTYMTSCTVTITSPECLLSKLSPSPKLKPSDLTNMLCVCHFSMKTLYNQLQVPTTGVTPGPHTHALAASFTHTFCLHIWPIRQPGNAHSGKAVTRTRNRSPSSPRSPLSLCARAQRWWRHLYSIYGVITGVNKVTVLSSCTTEVKRQEPFCPCCFQVPLEICYLSLTAQKSLRFCRKKCVIEVFPESKRMCTHFYQSVCYLSLPLFGRDNQI